MLEKIKGKCDNVNKKQKNMYSKKVEVVYMDLFICELFMC